VARSMSAGQEAPSLPMGVSLQRSHQRNQVVLASH
jgi:hypothetical protein